MKNLKLQTQEFIKGVESNKIFTCGVSKDSESLWCREIGGGNLTINLFLSFLKNNEIIT